MKGVPEDVIEQAVAEEFACHRCGACCKGDGVVEFGREEAERMAEHLRIDVGEFVARYAVAQRRGRYYLIDQQNEEKWCIFLQIDDKGRYGCKVNAAKPDQCRGFPYGWRNPDSFETCMGLRTLMTSLRARAAAGAGASIGAAAESEVAGDESGGAED